MFTQGVREILDTSIGMKYILSFFNSEFILFILMKKASMLILFFLTSGMLVSLGMMLWSGDRTWENYIDLL